MSARIIINDRFYSSDGEYKKYRSTQEQIRENQRENQIQRQRDEQARNESTGNQNTSTNTVRRQGAA